MNLLISCQFSSFLFFTLVIFMFSQYSQAKVEFCLRGRHELYTEHEPITSLELDTWFSDEGTVLDRYHRQHVGKITGCSSGVLFNKPFQLEAVAADDEPFCYKESICDEKWRCHFQKNSIVAEIIKIGKPSKNESWLYDEGDREMKSSIDFEQCQPFLHGRRLIQHNINFEHSSRMKREITGLVPSEPTSADQIQREVDDQTKRMFYYLAGINQDQVNSHLRVVKIFKMSSQLVSMICDPQFISPRFLQEIERGFLFILKEQGFDKMTDLDLESYNQLRHTLEHCASTVKMVKFNGQPCPTGIKVDSVYQIEDGSIKNMDYERSPKSFKWGEYDIVIDAAWSTMSIVHAGCFDSFSDKVNLLHKFQVALEQLFHTALYFRWENPTQLNDDLFYDSMFMTRVNDTMEAMDACTRFLYLLTPLKTQINRPIHETFYKRKKRSTWQKSSEELLDQNILSMQNSLDASRELTLANQQDENYYTSIEYSSSEERDDRYKNAAMFECLKTEHERRSKVRMAQMREYDDCKGHPKRNSG